VTFSCLLKRQKLAYTIKNCTMCANFKGSKLNFFVMYISGLRFELVMQHSPQQGADFQLVLIRIHRSAGKFQVVSYGERGLLTEPGWDLGSGEYSV
jgi:hypothetical protein